MKKIIIVFALTCLVYACQKTPENLNTDPVPSNCRLTRIVQGLVNDTVFLISYDSDGRISKITDSTNKNVYTVRYDAAGKLIEFTDGHSDFIAEYNADGMPYKITTAIMNGSVPFAGAQYTYEYNAAKKPVKRTEYLLSNGRSEPWEVKRYEFVNEDIIRAYFNSIASGHDSTIVETVDYTYTADSNVFQSLCFFGTPYSGLGLFDMLDIDFYFNKHLFLSSDITNGPQDYVYHQQYSKDSITHNIIKAEGLRTYYGQLANKYTRVFFFNCK